MRLFFLHDLRHMSSSSEQQTWSMLSRCPQYNYVSKKTPQVYLNVTF